MSAASSLNEENSLQQAAMHLTTVKPSAYLDSSSHQAVMLNTTPLALSLVLISIRTSLALVPLGSPQRIVISPSIAKANFLTLGADLHEVVEGGAEWIHFSVQDGRMVPKISFGSPVVAACRDAFPKTVFDVKLGCIEPERRVEDFIKAGADIISVHPESTLQLGAVIHKIGSAGVAPGVVMNPGTSISAVEHVLDQCQVVVVMLVSAMYTGKNLCFNLCQLAVYCPAQAGQPRLRWSQVHAAGNYKN
jgi:ribulose-phosphate 3-epimerase